jgi:hypothetical protein
MPDFRVTVTRAFIFGRLWHESRTAEAFRRTHG